MESNIVVCGGPAQTVALARRLPRQIGECCNCIAGPELGKISFFTDINCLANIL